MTDMGKVTVEICPTVTQDTAETCMELVNWFLRENEGWRIVAKVLIT